ncbi:MAG: site-specific integrase [Streptosporangiaceae bacterium]|nr:site-specific integrase [Streptosporangiaceae bacterium]
MTAVAEQAVAAGPRGRVAGRESRRGPRPLPPAVLPDVPMVLPTGQQVRPDAVSWPQTEASRAETGARLLEIAGQAGGSLPLHRMSLRRLLDWLEAQPGSTWQQRWQASGAEHAGKDWAAPLVGSGRRGGGTADQDVIKAGMMLLLAGQVIRPGLAWLLDQPYYKTLAVAFTQIDPAGLEALQREHAARGAGGSFATARNVIARIMICKGGPVTAVTAGDCAWYWHTRRDRGKGMNEGGLFYTLLFEMGVFGPDAPPNLMAATRRGQLSCAGLVDRYQIECEPVRDLLVDYLAVRRPAVDYTSLDNLARNLGLLFWRDLELHHPGISSLHLPAEVAAAWKLRLQVISHDSRRAGQQRKVPENTLMHVRAFYADLAAWAAEDPARWGRFAAPCPVRASEITFTKIRRHRKAVMDQRTRTLAPVLPALVHQVRADAIGADGRRLDLAGDEERAFWTWASVEVLRHTGVRIEEMLELTHRSFCAYTLPTTGEVVPMLQVAPSKTDSERLLLVSPDLGEVLAEVINRVRGTARALPLVARWDGFERRWSPLMPFLFQRPDGGVRKPLTRRFVADALDRAMAAAGLTGPDGTPLRITPHDFRRIFATDALRAGLPPHIAAKILGHIDLNTTMGYATIYPEDVITGHRAFIARRRTLRPGEEYRDLSPAEWDEFLGHFELRKVELGVCTRDFGTPCVHEHACIRCPALRPDPAQRPRLADILASLRARLAEAREQGWGGEVAGLEVSIAAAGQKLQAMDQLAARHQVTHLGMPDFRPAVGRSSGAAGGS